VHQSAPGELSDPQPPPEESFDRLIAQGHERPSRAWLPLIGTELLGGLDVGTRVPA
jgi:hypothetical protein